MTHTWWKKKKQKLDSHGKEKNKQTSPARVKKKKKKKKNLPTHRRGGKNYTLGLGPFIPEGGRRPLSKGGYLFDL